MPTLSATHFAIIVLVVAGGAIYAHQSERAEFEDEARLEAQALCAEDESPRRCEGRAEREHEACFKATFDPGSAGGGRRIHHRPPRLDRRAYLACVDDGFEPWREARAERRRDQAKQRHEALN